MSGNAGSVVGGKVTRRGSEMRLKTYAVADMIPPLNEQTKTCRIENQDVQPAPCPQNRRPKSNDQNFSGMD
jgi:hypothetical protein